MKEKSLEMRVERLVTRSQWSVVSGQLQRTTDNGQRTFRLPPSAFRHALTLIELLVVIVILMTLVGGVLPILSPNNDARKIKEASRGLQTYFQMAQAKAARTGRPVGVAFRETSAGSGVALEAFQIEVPPPFAGFSTSSSAIFVDRTPDNDEYKYEVYLGEGFGAAFNAGSGPYIPSHFVRVGDILEVGNAVFKLSRGYNPVDRDPETLEQYFQQTDTFTLAELVSGSAPPVFAADFDLPASSDVDFQQGIGQPPPQWPHPRKYKVLRQPVSTVESPYTFPAGVAVDLHASGVEGGTTETMFAGRKNLPQNNIKQLAIMFSPAGGVETIQYRGGFFGRDSADLRTFRAYSITDASRIVLLLGRVETGGVDLDADVQTHAWDLRRNDSDERLATARQEVNWLNLDSRWLAIDARSGRTVVKEMAPVDPRELDAEVGVQSVQQFAYDQIWASRRPELQ